MAIDLSVTDGIARSIEPRMLAIASAADKLEQRARAAASALDSLDSKKLAAFNKVALNDSKIKLNNANADLAAQKAAEMRAKASLAQAKATAAESARLGAMASRAEALSTQRQLNAEKTAQAAIRTQAAKVAQEVRTVEAHARAAAATTKQSYQTELLGHTPSMAKDQRNIAASRATAAQARANAALSQQDAVAARAQVTWQKLNTEQARGALIMSNNAVVQQRLSTELNRTTVAQNNAAASSSRAAAAADRATAAAARSQATVASANRSLSGVTASSRAAATGLSNTAGAMDRLNSSASFLRSDGLRWAKVLWALGGATLTAGAIVEAADAYTRLQNRLQIAAESQAQVNALTDEMGRIANASRQPVEETAKTFSRVDLAMKQLGRTQSDSMKITENVAKALKLGGATAGEAASAMLQLSQAFNKGKLDGDEFRSVMENSPIVADALATQLKVTRGELLKLAPEGKITATVMADAIIGATDKINAAFLKMKPTIAESFTVMRNQAILYFGELDKQLGVTAALSELIIGLANNLDVLTFAFMALAPIAAVFVGGKMIAGFGAMIAFAGRTAVAIGAIRNPIVTSTVALVNMGRQAVASGIALQAAFTGATTRAIAFQLATVRAAAGVAALAGVARAAGVALMSMFSFGNVLMMIAVATAALVAFGDQMVVNAKTGVTMRDMTIAVFQELGDFISDVFNSMYEMAVIAFGGIVDESQTTTERVGDTIFAIALATAVTFDACVTVVSNFMGFLSSAAKFFGDTIYNVFVGVSNLITSAVNVAIGGLNLLIRGANSALSMFGSNTQFGEIGYMAGRDFSTAFIDSLGSDLYGNKHLAADTLVDLALPRIQERAAAIRSKKDRDTELRGADAAQAARAAAAADGGKKKKEPKSDAERRADIIKKAVIEEQKAIAVSQLLGDERERQAKIEDVNGKLAMRNYALLSDAEKKYIGDLVDRRLMLERIGAAMQTMYDNVTKPARDHNEGLAAANNLLKAGKLNQEQYTGAINKVTDAYRSATEASYSYLRALDAQKAVQGTFGRAGEVAKALQDAQQKRRDDGLSPLTATDIAEISSYTEQLYNLRKEQEAMQSLWASSVGALEDNHFAMRATAAAYDNGAMSAESYTRAMAQLVAQQGTLNESMNGITDPLEPFTRGLYQLVADMPSLGQGMADALQSTLGNAIDNLSSTMTDMILNFDAYAESVADALDRPVSTLDVMRYALSDIVNTIGKELINAVIKLGVQWAVQAALSKSIGAAATASQIASAQALNAAWTPAAISASIATMGSAATIGTASFVGAQTVGKMTSLAGFADGSDIIQGAGTGRSDSILARLSAGEMVMNQEAVRNNYPMLRAMQSGDTMGGGYVDNSVHVSVTIHSDGSEQSEGDMSTLAKNIAGFVKLEVKAQLGRSMRQGQPLY